MRVLASGVLVGLGIGTLNAAYQLGEFVFAIAGITLIGAGVLVIYSARPPAPPAP